MTVNAEDRSRFVRGTAIGGCVGLLPTILMLTGGRFNVYRTAVPGGVFGNIFDAQARALMDGHFDLKRGSLAIESFIVDDKTYTYFPPFPALIRIPILLFSDLDGRLTTLSMMLAFVVTAAAVAGVTWRVRLLVRGAQPVPRREAAVAGIFVASVTGGSVVLYLASLPWAYHEVYAWSIALAALSIWAITGILIQMTATNVVIACAAVTAAQLTRSTVGWGMSVALVLCAVWSYRSHHRWRHAGPPWSWLLVAAVLPLIASGAVTWMKFGSPLRFLPLENQVWTMVNEQRRRALAANGGSLTNPRFFPTTVAAYLSPTNIGLRPYFPFITLPPTPPPIYGNVVFDQTYRVGSATAFMPLLLVLSLSGVWGVLRRTAQGHARRLLIPVLGSAFALGGVLNYGYLANRYISDFMPFAIIAGAIGVTQVVTLADTMTPRSARALAGALVALGLWGVTANGAVAITAMQYSSGGDGLRAHIGRQLWLADTIPGIGAPPVRRDEVLPLRATADTVQVVRNCDAMFVATGETYEPWTMVSARSATAELRVPSTPMPKGTDTLVSFDGPIPASVAIESDGDGSIRMRLGGPAGVTTRWFPAPPGETLEFTVQVVQRTGQWLVFGPGLELLPVAIVEYDADWLQTYRLPLFDDVDTSSAGWDLHWTTAPADPVCVQALDVGRR